MSRRVEVSFTNPDDENNMVCCLYHLPSYNHIFNINFYVIYEFVNDSQKKKLNKLKTDRKSEIVLNLSTGDLRTYYLKNLSGSEIFKRYYPLHRDLIDKLSGM